MICRGLRLPAALISLVLLSLVLAPQGASAQAAYTRLQILMPGESQAPGTGSGRSGSPLDQTVGVPFTITVNACDDNWNTVGAVTNNVDVTSSDASATLPASVLLANGTAQFTVTLNAAGSFTFSADDLSDPTIPQATSSNVAAFLLQSFEFDRISQKNQNVGVPMSITLSALDPNGNPVSGYNGQVRLQQITSFGQGRITPDLVTMNNGAWSGNVTMFRADETSINRGNVNIFALLDSDPSVNGTSDPFTVHPGSFSRVQIVVPGQSPAPGSVTGVTGFPASQGGGQNFVVDVFATDLYYNPVPSSDNVRVTSSDPAASTPVTGSMSNGFRQFTLSLGTTGTQTLTITDQTNGSIQGMTTAGIPVGASAPDHFEFDPIAGPVTAGSNVAVTVRATDVSGNTVTTYSGNAVFLGNTGPGSISPEAVVFNNGVWTGDVVFRGAGGAVSISCSDFASPPHVGTSNNFEVIAGSYSGLQVLLPGQTPAGGTSSGFTGTPDDQNAGSSFNLTIRAVDAFWNRVTGTNANVSLSSSDGFAAMPSDTALVNGELVMPITLFATGNQTITASDSDTPSITADTSSPVFVLPGTYSRVVLIAPGESIAPGAPEGRSGTATDQSINFAFTVSVYATDQWFNPVTGISDVVRLTSGDPLAQLPADTPMSDGSVDLVMRLSTGGFQQIAAENVTATMPVSTTQVRAISSGLHLEADVSSTNVQAGEQFNLTVRVTNDAGAVIQEVNSSVTVEVQNASTQAPGRGVLENTQFQLLQGQRTIAETYTFAEDIVLTIRDDAGNTPAITEVISVSPGAPSAVELSSSRPWVPGNATATITARVVDAFDNGVPAQPVTFTLVSGGGMLTPIDNQTSAEGAALAEFLSPRMPDVSRIRVVSNAFADEMDIETALVDPTKPAGSVTNYPNPFHPGEAPTTIAYKLSDNATVTMQIFTITGSLVYRANYEAGQPGGTVGLNTVSWDGRNGRGEPVASGGYILVIEANGDGETLHNMSRKIAVVR